MHTRRVRERTGNTEGFKAQSDRDCRIPAAFPSRPVRAGIRAREIAARRLPMLQAQWRNGARRDHGSDRSSLTVAGAAQAWVRRKARDGRRKVKSATRFQPSPSRSRLSTGTAPVSRLTRLMAQAGHPKPCCSQRPLTDSRRTATREFYPSVQGSSIYICG